jgi:cytochrome oxidase Cu insertion factor (SCO1/SenC/PrrC family)
VGIDELDPDEKTLAFVKQYKLPYEVVTDSDGVTGKAYYTIGLPMHVFIDRSGKISTFRQGEMTPDEIEAAIKKIVQK